MALIILLFVISIPVIELSVLISVGGEIGAFSTVALCLLTAAAGLSLVRLQGMQVFANMQKAAQIGEPVGENLLHGFFLLIAGLFLLIPGFVTDTLGALLLIPFIRLWLGRAGLAHMVVKARSSHYKSSAHTIDGEFSREDDSEADIAVKTIIIDQNSSNNEEK